MKSKRKPRAHVNFELLTKNLILTLHSPSPPLNSWDTRCILISSYQGKSWEPLRKYSNNAPFFAPKSVRSHKVSKKNGNFKIPLVALKKFRRWFQNFNENLPI